ncbi:uncharacterized protein LODBEIA_P26300 [Lodderomyces beijingensis]|uniref:candidapepsin n=1 Tax=Lodderomyces beijingensis TaxID=1775926 RepID=A0ABP0ZMR0_9ASCO
MKSSVLGLLLVLSTSWALIGDGFIQLPVTKVVRKKTGVSNRIPIYEEIEKVADRIEDGLSKLAAPFLVSSPQSSPGNGPSSSYPASASASPQAKAISVGGSPSDSSSSSDSNAQSSASNSGGTGAFFLELVNEEVLYYATLAVGSPAQEIEVMVDTGSSDLWFVAANNPQCKANGGSLDCDKHGTYNKSKSSSASATDNSFSINYFDGSKAEGKYYQDSLEFASGFALDNATFAIVENTTSTIGVFGVGYEELEATSNKYTNVPLLMKNQGLIARAAYSLYLDSKDAQSGYILFGGIDHAKFTGNLVEISVVPSNGKYVYLQIPLSHVAASINNYTDAYPTGLSNGTNTPRVGAVIYNGTDSFNGGVDLTNEPALLDSGTTYSYLAQSQVESIVGLFGNVTYNQYLQAYDIPCWLRNSGNYLQFNFNQQKDIQVPISEFIVESGKNGAGVPQCVFGILPGSMTILGGNFMRSVYAVFDLEANGISIAQAAYNNEHQVTLIE